jgi:hypothetical protein
MQTTEVNFSPEIYEVLSQYPQWLDMLIRAIDRPTFSRDYCPSVVEVFDQYGLLCGRIHGYFSYESKRTSEQKSDFIAWLLDGELAVFCVGSEVVIDLIGSRQSAVGSSK